jgi:NAD(P)-dependent dehydrogenase (short-subunit alcohol dehydrogenase family)
MLSGKNILVTGSSKRIGAAIVKSLAADGANLCIHYNSSRKEALELEAELKEEGYNCAIIRYDLSNTAEVHQLIDLAVERIGRLDALINNASLFEYDRVGTVTADSLKKHYDVNTIAPVLLSQAFAKQVKEEGCIINILDQKLKNSNPDYLSYTLSKAALAQATTLLALDLAPKVRVCGISPGLTLESSDQTTDEFLKCHKLTPLGKGSTVEDIAQAVKFILCASAYTGEIITIDGGQHLVPRSRDVMFDIRKSKE